VILHFQLNQLAGTSIIIYKTRVLKCSLLANSLLGTDDQIGGTGRMMGTVEPGLYLMYGELFIGGRLKISRKLYL
jgi:hypothetical protein